MRREKRKRKERREREREIEKPSDHSWPKKLHKRLDIQREDNHLFCFYDLRKKERERKKERN